MRSTPYALRRLRLLGLGFLLVSSSPLWALGIGNVTDTPVLGEPLNVIIPIYGSPDEQLPAECVRSEVVIGESPLIGKLVKTQLLPPGQKSVLFRVQVSTSVKIDEPLVSVSVTVGCHSPINKQFLMFVDPPASITRSTIISPSSTQGTAMIQASQSDQSKTGSVTPPSATSPPPRKPSPKPLNRRQPPPLDASSLAVQAAKSDPKVIPESARKASSKATIENDAPPAKINKPRLSLENPHIDPSKGVSSSNLDRDPDYAAQLAKLAELEQILAELKAQKEANKASTDNLQAQWQNSEKKLEEERKKLRLVENELERERQRKNEQPLIVWVLIGIVIVLGATLGLMLWNQRRNPKSFLREHETHLSALGDAPHSFLNSAQPQSAVSASVHQTLPTPKEPVVAEIEISEITESQLNHQFHPAKPLQETATDTSDELIDLEQQADFFIALGQDHMAIDLLNGHIQDAHSSNPRPYLKLLEILVSKNDHAAFEKLQLEFLRRFNARIPDWGEPQNDGKSLENYPQISLNLISHWPTPDAVLKLLNSYLLKIDGQIESFDLPAYQELIFLQAVAKDLLKHDLQKISPR